MCFNNMEVIKNREGCDLGPGLGSNEVTAQRIQVDPHDNMIKVAITRIPTGNFYGPAVEDHRFTGR